MDSGGFGGGFGGFGDEEDLGDLIARSRLQQQQQEERPSLDADVFPQEDLSSNPFADLESSRSLFLPSQPHPPAHDTPDDDGATLTSPSSPFARESAPEPETPFSSTSTSTATSLAYVSDPYPTSPVFTAPPADEQTPFGSPPVSPIITSTPAYPVSPTRAYHQPPLPAAPAAAPEPHTRQRSVPDISDLLGEEKPILPTFARKRDREASALSSHAEGPVLPVSSIGKRSVGGPLAALLGMQVDDDEPEPSTPAPTISAPTAAPTSSSTTTPTLTASTSTIAPPLPASVSALSAAEATPLPPSPSESPPPSALSRASSFAPSTASTSEAETEPSAAAYASVVSPLLTGESGVGKGDEAWPGAMDALGGKLEKLSVLATSEGTAPQDSAKEGENEGPKTPPRASSPVPEEKQSPFGNETSPSSAPLFTSSSVATSSTARQSIFDEHDEVPSSPLAQSRNPSISTTSNGNGPGFRSYNGSVDDSVRDDVDSLRGTYSRSFAETDETEGESGGFRERREASEGLLNAPLDDAMLPTSPPLPSVPAETPFTSPNPAAAAPIQPVALAPSFIITVGDPQKVGSSLNVAAQHTVYTVRTQTTATSFRKKDFSVLRRFSHFLWLFDALTLNNPGVIVPGMPEKNAMGRFGSEFVENRRSALQATLMKIVAHPMLVGDPDLRLFLESDTFSLDVKQRKLNAPVENKGFLASLGSSISGPKFFEFDNYFDDRRIQLETFENQLRSLLISLNSASKARSALQASFSELQSAFVGLSLCDLSGPLRGALEHAAAVQKRVAELSEEQTKSEESIGGIIMVAEGYARLCGSVKLIFGARIKAYHTWQAAESNLKKAKAAHEKAKASGRHSDMHGFSFGEISDAERKMLTAKQDFEDVAKLTKAELARFDKEKIEDFKKAVVDYTEGMCVRQREVVSLWANYHEALLKLAGANTGPLQIEAPPAAEAST